MYRPLELMLALMDQLLGSPPVCDFEASLMRPVATL